MDSRSSPRSPSRSTTAAGGGPLLRHPARGVPAATITGCDVSAVAVRRAQKLHPDGTFLAIDCERIPVGDAGVDLLLSVEILEHPADVVQATREIGRVLRPGGVAVISTPCANRWSLEWGLNRLRPHGLQPSPDGYGCFATDEPGHLRRLESRDLAILLAHAGMTVRIPFALRVRIAMLDWRLWRRRPNGATMVVVATKTATTARAAAAPPAGGSS